MPDYPKAAQNVVYVGLKIASFILNNKISPSNVHCIGHSLGWQDYFILNLKSSRIIE
jgi:hypothetical protein